MKLLDQELSDRRIEVFFWTDVSYGLRDWLQESIRRRRRRRYRRNGPWPVARCWRFGPFDVWVHRANDDCA